MGILNIENLYVSYGTKEILKNINVEIHQNKITAIIGPSGCGKSTLLSSINRMIEEEPTSKVEGKIYLNNVDLDKFEMNEIRRKIGIVFQKPTPFPFSIYKNLTYAPKYYGAKGKKELDKIVERNLKVTGLYEEVKNDLNMLATNLSGGQQQRLCIARALTVEPKILLLDEPCSSLDIKSTAIIEDMLKNLSKDYTIIIVTHNLNQAKRISDYTMFMLDGELIEYDRTEKMFSDPEKEETKDYIGGIYG